MYYYRKGIGTGIAIAIEKAEDCTTIEDLITRLKEIK